MTQTKQPKTGSKFTPGPWRAELAQLDGGCAKALLIAASEVSRLPICPAEAAGRDLSQANANARLIAKAPEMYELLERIELTDNKAMDSIPTMPSLHEWVEIARAARRIKAAIDGEG